MKRGILFAAGAILGAMMVTSFAMGSPITIQENTWAVQYITDQSQTIFGVDQFDRPRDCRGLALSPDLQYLYVGYNNPSSGYLVRKIDLSVADYNDATLAHLSGYRGKAIATDDVGRVYLANSGSIDVFNADLDTSLGTLTQTKCEGLAATRIGGQLYVYASDRTLGTLTRYAVTEGVDSVSLAVDTGWATAGSISLGTGIDLRGLEVDEDGKIWVADNDGAVHIVAADGSSSQSVAVDNAFDVAFYEGVALISRDDDRLVSQIDMATLADLDADFSAPLAEMLLTPTPLTGGTGTYGQIVVAGDILYIAGEAINTANEHSTYGRVDEESGYVGETYYIDTTHDDNDPILRVTLLTPEPTTLGLLGIGALALLYHRRKKRA